MAAPLLQLIGSENDFEADLRKAGIKARYSIDLILFPSRENCPLEPVYNDSNNRKEQFMIGLQCSEALQTSYSVGVQKRIFNNF